MEATEAEATEAEATTKSVTTGNSACRLSWSGPQNEYILCFDDWLEANLQPKEGATVKIVAVARGITSWL